MFSLFSTTDNKQLGLKKLKAFHKAFEDKEAELFREQTHNPVAIYREYALALITHVFKTNNMHTSERSALREMERKLSEAGTSKVSSLRNIIIRALATINYGSYFAKISEVYYIFYHFVESYRIEALYEKTLLTRFSIQDILSDTAVSETRSYSASASSDDEAPKGQTLHSVLDLDTLHVGTSTDPHNTRWEQALASRDVVLITTTIISLCDEDTENNFIPEICHEASGGSLLHWAAGLNLISITTLLVNNHFMNENIDFIDTKGYTPLYWAIEAWIRDGQERTAIITCLIENGATIEDDIRALISDNVDTDSALYSTLIDLLGVDNLHQVTIR